MSRPSDWYVVDLGGDPTPGEAWGVRTLAREYGEIAASARSASTVLTRVQSSGSSAVWVGEAAEVFREKLEDFPENIAKCAASFEIVRDAMYSWASSVESWQSQADTNLNKARLARADIEAAQAALVAAQDAAASVQGDLDRVLRTYNQYQYIEPPANIKVPTAYQISQLRYRATGASSSTTSASGTVQEAQDRFDAAKALVLAAAEEFAAAAKTVVGTIEAAKDAGVEADSWWEKIYHSDAWQVMVTIVTVVVIVAAIAAFFVTGPLALIISAVAIVGNVILNAQDIMAFAAGDMSAAEFATMLALAFLPGGRAMKSLGDAADVAAAAARTSDEAAGVVATATRRADDAEAVRHGPQPKPPEADGPPHSRPIDDAPVLTRSRQAVPEQYSHLPTREVDSGSKGAWQSELHKPEPSTVYLVDDRHLFVTDDMGRVTHVESDLKYTPPDVAALNRNGYQQGVAGREFRFEIDEGGHLAAVGLGGPGEGINIVAMDKALNRQGADSWGSMEMEWFAALKGDPPSTVRAIIDIDYPPGSLRPEGFTVQPIIDGTPTDVRNFVQ